MGTIRHVISLKAPLDRVWSTWSNPTTLLPRFENFISGVRILDTDTFEATYRTILARQHTLRVVETERVDKKLIAWKATEGPVSLTASLTLENAGAETILTFVFCFDPPGVRIGDVFAEWIQYPHTRLEADLKRLSTEIENA